MTFERPGLTAFVPKGDDRRATARALVDLANEHGIPQTSIQSANDGFYITDELADVLYDDSVETASADDDKSVPATQTYPQTHEGQGDSTAGGNQNTKAENVTDDHGNVEGSEYSGAEKTPKTTDKADAETAPTKKKRK